MSHGLGFWRSGLLVHTGPWVYFTILSYCVLLIFSRLITQRFEGCTRQREKPLQLFLHWLSSLRMNKKQNTMKPWVIMKELIHVEWGELLRREEMAFSPESVWVIGKAYIFLGHKISSAIKIKCRTWRWLIWSSSSHASMMIWVGSLEPTAGCDGEMLAIPGQGRQWQGNS